LLGWNSTPRLKLLDFSAFSFGTELAGHRIADREGAHVVGHAADEAGGRRRVEYCCTRDGARKPVDAVPRRATAGDTA
jgi:hypothetical protein